jgi:hypothetical protein
MIDLTKLDKFYIDDFVKDIFIGMLQQLFSQNPGEFHYDDDAALTRIELKDQFSTDNLTPDFKPTIYIRRRPLGFMNTSIDQFAGQNYNTSKKFYTDMISGVAELVCVSREGLEACRLGSIVFLLINEFVGEFRKLGMFDVSVKSLGEEEPKDVRSTFRVVEVPITVQYIFQYSWMVQTMGLTALKEIELGRSTNVATGARITGVPKTPCGGEGVADNPPQVDENGNIGICIPMTERSPGDPMLVPVKL